MISSSGALAYVDAMAAAQADHDPTQAFATLTVIGGRGNTMRRYCLETLSPSEYERFADELQQRLRDDAADGACAAPLNERACIAVVVCDVDQGSPSVPLMLLTASLLRSAFAVHFGVETAAYVAMRASARGELKYHLYFPGVLLVDPVVLTAALELARVNVKVDRLPAQARQLRVHGSDKCDGESGLFTGAGIYRLVGGFDKRGSPLPPDCEPARDDDGLWHSVRAGERLIRRLLLDPDNAYPRASTSVARTVLASVAAAQSCGSNAVAAAWIEAAAGGDDAREVKLLLSAHDGSWFVVSSHRPCAACGDARTEWRCLARLARFVDGAGDAWLTIYRWALCLGCCEVGGRPAPVQSLLPPLILSLDAVAAPKIKSVEKEDEQEAEEKEAAAAEEEEGEEEKEVGEEEDEEDEDEDEEKNEEEKNEEGVDEEDEVDEEEEEEEENECESNVPRLMADDEFGVRAAIARDNLLDLPIEVVYPAGFGHVDVASGKCVVERDGERRVSPERAHAATTVTALTRQLLACTPGAHRLLDGAIVESRVELSVADCTVRGSDGEVTTNLCNGMRPGTSVGDWAAPAGAHTIELLKTPCGAGKTEFSIRCMMRALLPGNCLLVIAPRVVLCEQLVNRIKSSAARAEHRWHVLSYKQVSSHQRELLPDSVLVTTLESLPRFASMQFAGVVVDELCTVVHALHCKTTESRRSVVLDAFVRVVARARHSIMMDRDIGAGERLFVAHVVARMQHDISWPRRNVIDATVRAPAVHVRHVTMADPVRRTVELWRNTDQMIADMKQQLLAEKNIAVFCATKSDAEKLYECFNDYFENATLITGDTDPDVKREFALAPDEYFAARSTRIWLYTTAASVGLSVDNEYFHEVYAIGADFLSLRALLQAEARLRLLVGQARHERRIHLCLPPAVFDRTESLLRRTMPTVGSVVAAHEYALRHTRAIDDALIPSTSSSPPLSPLLLLPNVVPVDIDCKQLYEPAALLLQTLAAMELFERQMTRVVFEHWCVDAGITVIEHEPPADPTRDIAIVAVRASIKVAAKKRSASQALARQLSANAAPSEHKKSRHGAGEEQFAPEEFRDRALRVPAFVEWIANDVAATQVRVWLASIVCDAPLLSQSLLAARRRAGGAEAALEPLNAIALLGKLALQFLGLSGVLRGETPTVPLALLRIDNGSASPRALSPRDGRTLLTPDQFFDKIARQGLVCVRGRGDSALLPSLAGFAQHFRNLSRGKRPDFTDPQKRVKLLLKIAHLCYGDIEHPRRYLWSLAHWLAINQRELCAMKERLFDAPTLALLEATALTNPWAM